MDFQQEKDGFLGVFEIIASPFLAISHIPPNVLENHQSVQKDLVM